ncbi:MAG TPA: hypothetical protein VGO48_07715 [Conexibacter sp.]|jgi:hypothetical protein|nr:hypothetical protein [Conexibacter sp.]
MTGWSDARGQATSEYVALVALVAVALALAAGLTSGGVAGHVLAGLQRGLCRVAGTACQRSQPPDADLAPCPVERTTSGESLEGAFEVVKLGRGGTLTAVRRSDGRVVVTLADATTASGEVGLGFELGLGAQRGGKETAGIETSVSSGRSWTLPNAAAAHAFIDRYGSKATIGGKAVDVVRSGCSVLCDAIGWHPHAELPPPDETYLGRSATGTLTASAGPASTHAGNASVLGVRLRRDGGSTWFTQLDASADAELAFGAASLGASSLHQSVVAFTFDARNRPAELAIHTVIRISGAAVAHGERGRTTASLGAGGARVTELDATLDLHDARNQVAAAAFATALRDPFAVVALRRRAAAVGERIARTGVINRRTYALSSSAFSLGGRLALGAQLGGGFERTREGMRLLTAETRLPGLPFLPRDDCRAG